MDEFADSMMKSVSGGVHHGLLELCFNLKDKKWRNSTVYKRRTKNKEQNGGLVG